jgi:hypothetical protein
MWGFLVVVVGLATIAGIFAGALVRFATAQDAIAVIGAGTGAIGTIVTAFFGIHATSTAAGQMAAAGAKAADQVAAAGAKATDQVSAAHTAASERMAAAYENAMAQLTPSGGQRNPQPQEQEPASPQSEKESQQGPPRPEGQN